MYNLNTLTIASSSLLQKLDIFFLQIPSKAAITDKRFITKTKFTKIRFNSFKLT